MESLARSVAASAALLLTALLSILGRAAPHDRTSEPAVDPGRGERVVQADSKPASPPVTFADPDGQELILEHLSVRAAIHGMLSLTEMEFRFRNPQSRRIEGRFTCTLPEDATISRFAKDVNGHLMEGEVVERLRANQVYEQFLHQMRDPALLEQEQGNRFSARIFPIEPKAEVRLILSYTKLLPLRDGVRRYTFPLRGMQEIDRFSFRAFVSPLPGEESAAAAAKGDSSMTMTTADVYTMEERDYTPARDIELTWRARANAPASRILRAGDFYLAAFRPNIVTARAAAAFHDWVFYVDTSASSAESADHRVRALEHLLASLPPGDRVEIRAFDQEIAGLGSGTADEMSRSVASLLRTRLFLGGTDLAALLDDIRRLPRSSSVVIASDLVATVGDTGRKAIHDRIRALPGGLTVHALILGSRQDAALARALTAGRGRVVTIPFTDAMQRRAEEAAAALTRPVGPSVAISDAAAEWIYPKRIDDVQRGDEIIVLGRTGAGAEPQVRMEGLAAAEAVRSTLPAGAFAPLLEREAYRAYLDYLAERESAEESEAVRRALAMEQIRISIEQRVVIPRTTMLVLESEWEYQRFHLDRRALAAILTVDAGGIARIDRRAETQQWPVPPPVPAPMAKRIEPMRDLPSRSRAEAPAMAESIVAESKDEGGAVGGIAGGIVQDAAAQAAPGAVAAAPPPPIERQERDDRPALRQRNEERTYRGDWAKPRRATKSEVEDLRRRLEENRRDRETYNQLSEALAARGEWDALRTLALEWQPYDPENPQVYEVLALAGEVLGRKSEAARAAASLIEVAPGKTELLQRAGLLLVRLGRASLAEAPLRRALEVRPDRANGYRHLALMLWLEGRFEEAARVLEEATRHSFPGWYGDVQRVIREELVYVYRAWGAKEPGRRAEIADRALQHGADLDHRDALRVTIAWETDANDVDLHVIDPAGDECYYGNPRTRSGLELYQDITQGLGPEVIRTDRVERGAYHLGVRYFAAGPMGVSRGVVVVMRLDRGGAPSVEIHPFRLVQGGGDIRYIASVTVK